MDIKEALGQMDPLDDEQWTQDGLPKTETVSDLLGQKVTRQQILEAAPKFTKENMDLTDAKDDEQTTVPKEPEQPEETGPVDMSVLEEFLDKEPMLLVDFIEDTLKKMPKELLPTLETMLIEQQRAVEKKAAEVEEMRQRVKQNLSMARSWIKQLIPDMDNQKAIQEYLARSHAARASKAAKLEEVLGGLKPSDIAKLDPRAAIDKAFARKNSRGAQRPTR
jgi:two-component sensor histidine kinase